jgi:hypothetical protein
MNISAFVNFNACKLDNFVDNFFISETFVCIKFCFYRCSFSFTAWDSNSIFDSSMSPACGFRISSVATFTKNRTRNFFRQLSLVLLQRFHFHIQTTLVLSSALELLSDSTSLPRSSVSSSWRQTRDFSGNKGLLAWHIIVNYKCSTLETTHNSQSQCAKNINI